MIRFALLFSALAAPLAAQTTLEERLGQWLTAPAAASSVVMEAAPSGPLITSTAPAQQVVLNAPEPVVLAPRRAAPTTRPVPRPGPLPSAAEVVEIAAIAPPVLPAPVVAPEVSPAADVSDIQAAAIQAAVETAIAAAEVAQAEPLPAAPIQVAAAPATRPSPRPRTAEAVAMAEALAAQIVAEAHAIATAAPREVPQAVGLSSSETFSIPPRVIPEAAVQTQTPAPVVAQQQPDPLGITTPPAAVPVLTASLSSAPISLQTMAMAAVLLPTNVRATRLNVQPAVFIAPPLETAPILPRLRPSGPLAQEQVGALHAVRTASLSAVLMPSPAVQSTPMPTFERARAPAYDAFPMSALPPSALPEGPESQRRAIQPPRPFAEANAAVLTGLAPVLPVRLPAMFLPVMPTVDVPVEDPDAPTVLPDPDPNALARMMEDVMICWRLANLSVEAHWARLSVDVALDETNMPSAGSIRLTGFAHVVSGAAEDAYRAAHSALIGCAEATQNEPATASATLIFDRSGVRLQ